MVQHTPTPLTTQDVADANATIQANREQYWYAWQSFIAEQIHEVRVRLGEEVSPEWESVLIDTQREHAVLPEADLTPRQRQELEEVLDMRFQAYYREVTAQARESHQALPDYDHALKDLLLSIQQELHGKDGKAQVWVGGAAGQLEPLHYEALQQRLTRADVRALRQSRSRVSRRTGVILSMVGVLGLMGVLFIVFRILGGSATTSAPSAVAALVNGQTVLAWDITAMSIDSATIPIVGRYALGDALYLCVLPDEAALVQDGSTIILTGTTSIRRYTAHAEVDQEPRDLVLADCTQDEEVFVASARLQSAQTTLPLTTEDLVASVVVWESMVDPAIIPQDQMLVHITLRGSDTTEATLILPDGQRRDSLERIPTDTGIQLRYLVPAAPTEQVMGLEFAATPLPQRIALQVPAPLSRMAVLRDQVAVTLATTPTLQLIDQQPHLVVTPTVALLRGESWQLLPEDFVIQDQDSRPVEVLSWTAPLVQQDEIVPLPLQIPLADVTPPLDLSLSDWHVQLTWDGEQR